MVVPALALLGVVPELSVAGQPLWREGIPAWEQAQTALACEECDPPDSDALNREVGRVIGEEPTLIVRADALINPNGLRYVEHARLSAPAVAGSVGEGDLAGKRFVVAGATPAPYLPPVDPARLEATLRRGGFRPVMERRFGAWNTVVVWAARP